MLDFYVDESCKNGHRYLVLGCVVIGTANVRPALEKFKDARQAGFLGKELKWVKVSKGKLPGYKKIVDCFFDLVSGEGKSALHFHALIVDTSKLDNAKYNAGSNEIGFNKFVYQLLLQAGMRYRSAQPFYVYLDDRTTKHSTDELKDILNSGFAKKVGNATERPYHRVVFRDSNKTELIQICDLLLGSIGFKKNEHDKRVNASPAKCELARYVGEKSRRDLRYDTPFSHNAFRIWNIRLRQ